MGLCLPSSAHPGTWWQRTATTRRGFFRVETQRVFQACQRQALSCSKVQLCAQLQEDRTIIVCCKTDDRRCCYLAWALYQEERSTIQLLCTQEHEAIRSMKIIEGNGCIGWPEPRLQHHLFQHIHCRLCVCARTCVFVCGTSTTKSLKSFLAFIHLEVCWLVTRTEARAIDLFVLRLVHLLIRETF